MVDTLLVVIVVIAAAGYVLWKFMPHTARRQVAAMLVRFAQQRGGMSRRRAARLELQLAGKDCGACDTCGGCGSRSARQHVVATPPRP